MAITDGRVKKTLPEMGEARGPHMLTNRDEPKVDLLDLQGIPEATQVVAQSTQIETERLWTGTEDRLWARPVEVGNRKG
jgi:hypothetical protein